MPKNFNAGFISGVNFGRFMASIDQSPDVMMDEGYGVVLGSFALLQRDRRTVMARIDSERFSAERVELYRQLASVGVQGLTSMGTRSGHRRVEVVEVPIARFDDPLSRAGEADIIEAVATGIDVAFGTSKPTEVRLGPMNIVATKPS